VRDACLEIVRWQILICGIERKELAAEGKERRENKMPKLGN
jgi:hypothetical protein